MDRKENYSYSHASTIMWSLQQELNRHKARRLNNNHIEEYLLRRIAELKEYEKECLKNQVS
jgi:vacuolar-type H+-ATPase subunit B/Vma2